MTTTTRRRPTPPSATTSDLHQRRRRRLRWTRPRRRPAEVETSGEPDERSAEATVRGDDPADHRRRPAHHRRAIADVVFGQGYANGQDHACTLADQCSRCRDGGPRRSGRATTTPTSTATSPGGRSASTSIARADWATARPRGRGVVRGVHRRVEPPPRRRRRRRAVRLVRRRADGCSRSPPPTSTPTPARSPCWRAAGPAHRLHRLGPAADRRRASRRRCRRRPACCARPTAAATPGRSAPTSVTGGEGGLLVANPHFPWEGELRFWEVHLTVPGEVDIYGAQARSGLPGVGIGFTDEFAWTHTVSAGNRFTAYTLDARPGRPDVATSSTASRADDLDRPRGRGAPAATARPRSSARRCGRASTARSSTSPASAGPRATTLTYRDANIDNDEFAEQYLAMIEAPELRRVRRRPPRPPGRAAVQHHRREPRRPGLVRRHGGHAEPVRRGRGAVPRAAGRRPDHRHRPRRTASSCSTAPTAGSRGRTVAGARDPGLVPFDEMPMVERSDYVFNANDSFWMPHATEMLAGDYSRLHGTPGHRSARCAPARTPRVLSGAGPRAPAGDDGTFTGEELRDAAFANTRSLGHGCCASRSSSVATGATVVDGARAARRRRRGRPARRERRRHRAPAPCSPSGTVATTSTAAAPCCGASCSPRCGATCRTGSTRLWAEPFDPTPPGRHARRAGAGRTGGRPGARRAGPRRADADQGRPGRSTCRSATCSTPCAAEPRIGLHGGPGGDGLTNVVDYGDPSSTSEPMPDAGAPHRPRLGPAAGRLPGRPRHQLRDGRRLHRRRAAGVGDPRPTARPATASHRCSTSRPSASATRTGGRRRSPRRRSPPTPSSPSSPSPATELSQATKPSRARYTNRHGDGALPRRSMATAAKWSTPSSSSSRP